MSKKTISDSIAKQQCKKYLESLGYNGITTAKGNSCDLLAYKNRVLCMFEIKYSSRKSGSEFFGTVMFTELFQAIGNKNNYYFLLCRGDSNNLENWFYKIFSVKDFLDFCTLTTPIGHYRIRFNKDFQPTKLNLGKNGVKITRKMILDIWKKYREWKPSNR